MKAFIHLFSCPTKTSKTQSYLPLQERVMAIKNRRVSSHEIIIINDDKLIRLVPKTSVTQSRTIIILFQLYHMLCITWLP